MLGAIYGDIAGSVYEYNNVKRKDVPLFGSGCAFTDDTVVSIGVAEGLTSCDLSADDDKLRESIKCGVRRICREYPLADYGGGFENWLFSEDAQPYGSYGNGAAMRVGSICWLSGSLDEVIRVARISAEITHDHPDGISGAIATAGAAFLARTNSTKEQIRSFIEQYYPMDFTLDEIRDDYRYDLSCYGTVRPALAAFLESESFEDAIRLAISVGGDSDTLAAITGTVAEAYYGMSEEEISLTLSYLDERLLGVCTKFLEHRGTASHTLESEG